MNQREIGGFIEFEYASGKEYHENAAALNSGRHCVEYLIRAKHIRKLYIPYYMCDSVSALCMKLGTEVAYYETDISFVPMFDQRLEKDEWLYVVNFYGQLSDAVLEELHAKYRNIIVDNAQAFFRKPIEGVDTLYTCRKFFGVADGGYLYTDTPLEEELPFDCSYDRMVFLFGRMEKSAQEFYGQYVENNARFEQEPLKRMSHLTQNLMKGMDYTRIRETRTANFAYLHRQLHAINRLELTVPDGAFMYPLYIENGAALRRALQREKVYIPTLWPDVFDLCDSTSSAYRLAWNILPLPVDQRYGEGDMQKIVSLLEEKRSQPL